MLQFVFLSPLCRWLRHPWTCWKYNKQDYNGWWISEVTRYPGVLPGQALQDMVKTGHWSFLFSDESNNELAVGFGLVPEGIFHHVDLSDCENCDKRWNNRLFWKSVNFPICYLRNKYDLWIVWYPLEYTI